MLKEIFGWGRRAEVEARAKQLARVTMVIVHSLQTKSYEQFVQSFSNPGTEPGSLERLNRQLCFQLKVSPSSWYDAVADFSRRTDIYPCVILNGGGDDFGVAISAGPGYSIVELHVPPGQKLGRDAKAMVNALGAIPGWTNNAGLPRDLDLLRQ
jgi:hypothetical protein